MATTTSTPIAQRKVGVISTDIRGGGSYTTYTEGGQTRRVYGGGGGRTAQDVQRLVEPTFYTSELLGQSFISEEAKNKAEAEYKQQQARQQLINQLTGQSTTQQSLREIQGLSAKEKARQELMSKITNVRTEQGGYSYIDKNTGRGYEVSPTGQRKEIIPSGVSQLGFDTSTISGRLKYQLIEKDPILRRLAEKIKSYEEKKIQSPSELNKLNQQLTKRTTELIQGNKTYEERAGIFKGLLETPSYPVRKYYELFGAKFYKEGEREQITKDVLKEFNEATTYEQQQTAIDNLRNKGVKVILKIDPLTNEQSYQIDTSNIAPTSQLGNILVGATDIMFKGALFSPYMSTGATKKGEAKTKVVEKTKETTKKIKDLTAEEYSNFINKIRVTKTTQELRETYSKALNTGNKQLIKDTEAILKDALGESSALTLIRDVSAQEGFVSSNILSKPPRTTLQVDISDLFNVPRIKGIPETATGTNILNVDRDKNIFFESSKFKDQTGTSRFEEQTKTMFKDLGVQKSRFDTAQQTKQQETQKNILGLKTPQQELLKSETKQKQAPKESIVLLSLLKTQQRYKQEQKLKQQQVLKQKFKQPQPQKPRFKFPKPVWFKLPSSQISRLAKKVTEEPDIFKIFATQESKDIERGTFKTQREAELSLRKILKGELRAGGFVTLGGKPLKATELKEFFGGEFRLSKVSPYKIIQKRERRLSSYPERKEIQLFRKKSSGKKRKSKFSLFDL